MRAAPHYGLVPLLVAACARDPSPTAAPPADEAQAPSAIVPAASAASAVPVETAAPARSPAGPKRYALRFEDAGLPELVKAISEITGKRIVLSGNLPAVRASLYAPDEVTAEEAYQAFLTILASNGLTVVPRGRFLVIVPSPGVGGRK
jgi:general secretion pathway protein D